MIYARIIANFILQQLPAHAMFGYVFEGYRHSSSSSLRSSERKKQQHFK